MNPSSCTEDTTLRGGAIMTKELVPTNGFTSGKGQFLDYEADDGQVKIDVGLKDETVWLTQQRMADLFQNTKQNDGQHLKNIFQRAGCPKIQL